MKKFCIWAVLSATLMLVGCSTPMISNTGRTITEQQLLATVVERGIGQVDFSSYAGKKIFMEYDYLAPQVDKQLVQGYTELHLARCGVIVSRDAAQSDFLMQVSCGVLATDMNRFLLGSPALPIPMPTTSLSFEIPEIALFSLLSRTSYARFYFNILNAADRTPVAVIIGANSQAEFNNWTILFFPFTTYNIDISGGKPVETEVHTFFSDGL